MAEKEITGEIYAAGMLASNSMLTQCNMIINKGIARESQRLI